MPNCLILFHRPDFCLKGAADLLRSRGLSIEPQENRVLVSWGAGPRLRLYFANGETIRLEAEEIGAKTEAAEKLKDCDSRFEIAFDDLDEVLDEANTLIEVQLSLQDATGGFLFNSWNGQLTAPDV